MKEKKIVNVSSYFFTAFAIFSFCVLFVLILSFLIPFIKAIKPAFVFEKFNSETLENKIVFIQIFRSTIYTLKIAFFSTLVAIAIGFPFSFFLANRKFFGKKFLLLLSSVPLCMPPLLIALGFVMFFGMNGLFNQVLMTVFKLENPPITFLYSFWGIVIAEGFYNFPIIMKTCASVWEKIPFEQRDAAKMLGASEWRTFRTVTFFSLIPPLTSAAALVFLYCFFSFVIVMLFGNIGSTTLEVEIYQATRASLDFVFASRLAIVETLVALFAVNVWSLLEKHNSKTSGMIFLDNKNTLIKISGTKEKLLFLVIALLGLFFLVFPLLGIAYKGIFSLGFIRLFTKRSFLLSLKNTLLVSFSSSFLATFAASFYAVLIYLIDSKKKHDIFRTIPLLPMAVSSVVLGVGFSMMVKRGTPFILILAQASIMWPFALKQISSQIDRIPFEVIEAGKLLSPHKIDLVFRIILPMARDGIFSSLAFCFAISAGDATLPLVLAIPGFDTLALFTYRLAGAYRFSDACGAGSILAMLTSIVFFLGSRTRK